VSKSNSGSIFHHFGAMDKVESAKDFQAPIRGLWRRCCGNSTTVSSNSEQIERVVRFKLFGNTMSQGLKWSDHIDTVCSKASSRIHFGKQLKRYGVSIADLLHYCIYIYTPVWHSGIPGNSRTLLRSCMLFMAADFLCFLE
jgi:hypothetical protein